MTTKHFLFNDYVAAGCSVLTDSELSRAVYATVGSRGLGLCNKGCFDFKNGACKAYRALSAPAYTPQHDRDDAEDSSNPNETTREMAQRLGISLSEARRQRAAVATSSVVAVPQSKSVQQLRAESVRRGNALNRKLEIADHKRLIESLFLGIPE